MNSEYISPTKGKMKLETVAREIIDYIQTNPDDEYQLIIGTDSEGNGKVEFVTAIVIYRKGAGGRFFWKKIQKDKIQALRQKIFEEVLISIENAENLIPELNK